MSLIFKVLFLFMFSEILHPGTIYLSKSIDELSATRIGSGVSAVQVDGLEFSSHTIGYYDTVWEKRKVKNNINLGLEFLHCKESRGDFNFVTFYVMFNYKHTKKITSTIYTGIDFFNHDFTLNKDLNADRNPNLTILNDSSPVLSYQKKNLTSPYIN